MPSSVTAEACANIAFIKYWGNRGQGLNLPLNPSISMNLAQCTSTTTVELLEGAVADRLSFGGETAAEEPARRANEFLDRVRARADRSERLHIHTRNNFPTGCGIASSASGFAALARAAATVYGMDVDEPELSRIARLGSGSAARSVPAGFVELHPADAHEGAYAEQIAPPEAWSDLRDVVVVISHAEKEVGSLDGHGLAHKSEMLEGRLKAVPDRADRVRRAILDRDLTALGEASELDAISMHCVMMTSGLFYWAPRTLEAMSIVIALRQGGHEAYFTMDAGPNVHVLCRDADMPVIRDELASRFKCTLIVSGPGAGARVVESTP